MSDRVQTTERRWRFKGPEMEGAVARWYAGIRSSGSQIQEYRRQALQLTQDLAAGADVLEVAPGPGYLAIEIARLGRFHVTGLDISRSFVRIAGENARQAGVSNRLRSGRRRGHALRIGVVRPGHLPGRVQELRVSGQRPGRDAQSPAAWWDRRDPGHEQGCHPCRHRARGEKDGARKVERLHDDGDAGDAQAPRLFNSSVRAPRGRKPIRVQRDLDGRDWAGDSTDQARRKDR